MRYGLIAFSSTHTAIAAERRLKARYRIAVMPTPRQIAASCGISIRFSPGDLDAVRAELDSLAESAEEYALYQISEDGRLLPL